MQPREPRMPRTVRIPQHLVAAPLVRPTRHSGPVVAPQPKVPFTISTLNTRGKFAYLFHDGIPGAAITCLDEAF